MTRRLWLLTLSLSIFFAFSGARAQVACFEAHANPVAMAKEHWTTIVSSALKKIFFSKSVSSHELIDNDFFISKEGEVVVGLDGNSDALTDRLYHDSIAYLTGHYHANDKTVFHVKVSDANMAFAALKSIYAKSGPIKRLLIFGHGNVGRIEIGDTTVENWWYLRNANRLKELPFDLFAPDATVVLASCLCGAGYSGAPGYGVNTFRRIFSDILKQGGKVIALRRSLKIDLKKHDDPLAQELAQAEETRIKNLPPKEKLKMTAAIIPIYGLYALGKGLSLIAHDWGTIFSNEDIVEIPIPPTPQK